MRIEDAYIVNTDPKSDRYNEPGLIQSLKILNKGDSIEVCYQVLFPDGSIEFIPVNHIEHQQLLTVHDAYDLLDRAFIRYLNN